MSGNVESHSLRLHPSEQKLDRRVMRTRDKLGSALIALIQEKPFDEITVQEILDRAEVGRSTFYMHYRDMDDLFVSDMDEFLEATAMALSRNGDRSDRVVPVREFFSHVSEAQRLYRALVEADRLHDFLELARGHFARGIERRLGELPRGQNIPPAARVPLAQAYAGAMLSLLNWWIDQGMQTPSAQMDEIFHQMVWSGAAPFSSQGK